ncbi:type I restriction endonuclease subunit M, partial [Paenibacillus polymyxa]
ASLIDFYTAGRTRLPNMVTKGIGGKKREEQDGWVGSIVPNELIAKRLYSDELEEIELKKLRIQKIETKLSDLVEAAKVEDSDEANALGGILDEAGEAFEIKVVKAELKKANKGTREYDQLKKVEQLFAEKSALSKTVKADEKALKEVVQERILTLTNEEIDNLMYEKWFGNTVDA